MIETQCVAAYETAGDILHAPQMLCHRCIFSVSGRPCDPFVTHCTNSHASLSPESWARTPLPAQVFLLPDFLAITMEYAAGGDLFQLVGRAGGLREEDAKWYFQQIIVAIDYCHRMVRKWLPERGCCHATASPRPCRRKVT